MREKIGDNLAYEGVAQKIAPLLQLEDAFKRSAPNLYQELRRLVERGDLLTQTVMVRDFDAEIRSNSDHEQYKPEKRVIAKLEGDGFLRARTLSDTLSGRRRAFAMLVHSLAVGTDNLSDRDLRLAVQRVTDADEESSFAISSLRSAHRFFTAQNFENIRIADLKYVRELPELHGTKFLCTDRFGRTNSFLIPSKVKLPAPPSVYSSDNGD